MQPRAKHARFGSEAGISTPSWVESTLNVRERRLRFEEADLKLEGVKQELDSLVAWAEDLRTQRTLLMKADNHARPDGTKPLHVIFDDDVYAQYRSLVKEQETIEHAIAKVSSEYSYQRSARKAAHKSLLDKQPTDRGDESIHDADALAWASHRIQVHSSRMQTLAGIGALGVGIAYSTIFGAARGSLGLLAWSWAFCNGAVCTVGMLQLIRPTLNNLVNGRTSVVLRLQVFEVVAALFDVVGLVLLALSVLVIVPQPDDVTMSGNYPMLAGDWTLGFMGLPITLLVLINIFAWGSSYAIKRALEKKKAMAA